jgi:hypothetical protein
MSRCIHDIFYFIEEYISLSKGTVSLFTAESSSTHA